MAIVKANKVQFDTTEGEPYLNRDGKERMRLNSEQKARKYCVELSTGRDVYNDTELSVGQKAFRSGWLAKRRENGAKHNAYMNGKSFDNMQKEVSSNTKPKKTTKKKN